MATVSIKNLKRFYESLKGATLLTFNINQFLLRLHNELLSEFSTKVKINSSSANFLRSLNSASHSIDFQLTADISFENYSFVSEITFSLDVYLGEHDCELKIFSKNTSSTPSNKPLAYSALEANSKNWDLHFSTIPDTFLTKLSSNKDFIDKVFSGIFIKNLNFYEVQGDACSLPKIFNLKIKEHVSLFLEQLTP